MMLKSRSTSYARLQGVERRVEIGWIIFIFELKCEETTIWKAGDLILLGEQTTRIAALNPLALLYLEIAQIHSL